MRNKDIHGSLNVSLGKTGSRDIFAGHGGVGYKKIMAHMVSFHSCHHFCHNLEEHCTKNSSTDGITLSVPLSHPNVLLKMVPLT